VIAQLTIDEYGNTLTGGEPEQNIKKWNPSELMQLE